MAKLKIEWLPDGAKIMLTTDGAWDFTDTAGKHVRGQADTVEEARIAATEVYHKTIINRWMRGSTKRGMFVCPVV